jgi:hypothetical protein
MQPLPSRALNQCRWEKMGARGLRWDAFDSHVAQAVAAVVRPDSDSTRTRYMRKLSDHAQRLCAAQDLLVASLAE